MSANENYGDIKKTFGGAIKVSILASLGWGFELFDLVVYLYVATTVSEYFFPSISKTASILAFLLTLVVGYFARPIGALFFGKRGDKLGRKNIWLISLIGMGLGTVLMGFLPVYSQIGILATILLLVLRTAQGFFLGGEWGGGMVMVNEISPTGFRGFFSGIQQGGAALGLIFAVIASELALRLAPGPAFAIIGWRIMFWFGIIPLIIAISAFFWTTETPAWKKAVSSGYVVKTNFWETFKKHWKFFIVIILVVFGNATIYYGIIAYMPVYLGLNTQLSEYQIDDAVLVTNLIWLFSSPLAGILSDRLKVRKIWIFILFIMAIIATFPVIDLLHTGNMTLIYGAGAIVALIMSFQYAILPASYSENIPTVIRYTMIGLGINIGVALSSFAPYMATDFGAIAHNSVIGTSMVAISAALIGAIAMIWFPKDRVNEPLED